MQVKQINAKDTYKIRSQMLRPGLPLESCVFQGDEDDQTFHLGAFIDGKLVSVASFFYGRNENLPGENQFQLRGMATLPEFQKKGLSRELLKFAFPVIKQNFCNVVWCNARTSAQGFYETTGFKQEGNVFEIEGVGPHILMYRQLD